MDTLVSLMPAIFSSEDVTVVISLAIAAIVFFFCVHLLRKQESQQDVKDQTSSERVGAELHRQA